MRVRCATVRDRADDGWGSVGCEQDDAAEGARPREREAVVVTGVVVAVGAGDVVVVAAVDVAGTDAVVVSVVVVGRGSARAAATPSPKSSAAAIPAMTRCSGIAGLWRPLRARRRPVRAACADRIAVSRAEGRSWRRKRRRRSRWRC